MKTKAWYLLAALTLLTFLTNLTAIAKPHVAFAWDPCDDTNVIAYVLYWETESENYGGSTNVGNATNAVLTEMIPGEHYFFSLSGTYEDGSETDRSESIGYWVPGGTNKPPTISMMPNQNIVVGSQSAPIEFTVGDAETSVEQLYVGAGSAYPDLFPYTSFTVSGTGTNRSLILTPVSGQLGKATIIVWVNDKNGNSASTTFVVTVTATSEPPPRRVLGLRLKSVQ